MHQIAENGVALLLHKKSDSLSVRAVTFSETHTIEFSHNIRKSRRQN